jgi:hypothetical protein
VFIWRGRKIGLVIKIFLLVDMKGWFNYVSIVNFSSFLSILATFWNLAFTMCQREEYS